MRRTDLSTPAGRALFWSRVDQSEGCWLWIGARFRTSGYGRFKAGGRDTSAHIFAYEMVVAPVPEGLELDHLCRVRACVRPDHLEPVTHQVNELRGETVVAANARKEECLRGHPLSGENLFIRRNGSRRCQTCERAMQRVYRSTDAYRARHASVERARRALTKGR